MPGPVGSPPWAMKPWMTAVEDHAVVEAFARQLLDPRHVARGQVGAQAGWSTGPVSRVRIRVFSASSAIGLS